MGLKVHIGVYSSASAIMLTGATGVATAQNWSAVNIIGWLGIIIGAGIFLWGVRINERHLWQKWWKPHRALDAPAMMPFRDVVRRAALHSEWGLAYKVREQSWPTWQDDLKREFLCRLAEAGPVARGVRNARGEPEDSAPSPIPADFWARADFFPEHMLVDNNTGMVWQKGDPCPLLYMDAEVSRADVDRLWPSVPRRQRAGRASPFAALARKWHNEQEDERLTRNAGVGFDVAWNELAKKEGMAEPASNKRAPIAPSLQESGRIPFSALRDMAMEAGLNLDHLDPAAPNLAYDLEGELKEAAANNRLMVWGRPYNGPVRDNDPLVPIPRDHFRKYGFRHGALHYVMSNEQTRTMTMEMIVQGKEGLEGETFYDLHVSAMAARAVIECFARERATP